MQTYSDVDTLTESPTDPFPPQFDHTKNISPQKLPPPKPHSRIKRFTKFLIKQLKCLSPFLLIILYSLFGAWVFMALEHDSDSADRLKMLSEINEARNIFRNILYEISSPSENWRIRNRTWAIINAIEQYEEAIGFSVDEEESPWDFFNSLLYAGTIYTTIGYGNIACKTTTGRIVTIIYAIFGIPITLSVLDHMGNLLLKLMEKLTGVFYYPCMKFKNKKKKGKSTKEPLLHIERDIEKGIAGVECKEGEIHKEEYEYEHYGEFKTEHENDPPLLATLICTIGWLFICSAIFCIWEDWDYFTSFYFFFISLSTIAMQIQMGLVSYTGAEIGIPVLKIPVLVYFIKVACFGDIVPDYPQYMIMNVGLVFIGLALVSVTINVVQQKLEDIYMAVLTKLLNDYLNHVSDTQDGFGANVGMIQSWAANRKAKFLVPLLSKSKRKLVMQRLQEEAKAQGIELPPTLTDLNPGTGLPSILSIEREPTAVQQYLEQKEQETLSRPRPSRLSQISAFLHTSPSSPLAHFPLDQVHIACQTSESIDMAKQKVSFSGLRETSSQTDVINGQQAHHSKLREVESERQLGFPAQQLQKCTGSQTELPCNINMMDRALQYGTGFSSLISTGSQTRVDRGSHRSVQTRITSMKDLQEQTCQTTWDLIASYERGPVKESWSQTNLAKTDSTSQTERIKLIQSQCQTEQSMFNLMENQSQTYFSTRETPIQVGQSSFDTRQVHSQTLQPDLVNVTIQTPISYFETKLAGAQTHWDVRNESLQTLMEIDETGSQIQPDTNEAKMQAGQAFFLLRNSGSQTNLDFRERQTQTLVSAVNMRDVEVGRTSEESSSQLEESDASIPTGPSLAQRDPQRMQTLQAHHFFSKTPPLDTSTSTSSSTTPPVAPFFRQMSLQKIPPPFRRQMTMGALACPSTSQPFEEVSLRKVQVPNEERKTDSSRDRSALQTEPLPSVNKLISQFEEKRRESLQPTALDLPTLFPHLKGRSQSSRKSKSPEMRKYKEDTNDSSTSSE